MIWRAAVRGYEEAMFARAEVAAEEARDGLDSTFSEEGFAQMLQQIQGRVE